jgi:hypothetical protein
LPEGPPDFFEIACTGLLSVFPLSTAQKLYITEQAIRINIRGIKYKRQKTEAFVF